MISLPKRFEGGIITSVSKSIEDNEDLQMYMDWQLSGSGEKIPDVLRFLSLATMAQAGMLRLSSTGSVTLSLNVRLGSAMLSQVTFWAPSEGTSSGKFHHWRWRVGGFRACGDRTNPVHPSLTQLSYVPEHRSLACSHCARRAGL